MSLLNPRYILREQPVAAAAVLFGLAGPIIFATIVPIQNWLGYEDPKPVPRSYPCKIHIDTFQFCSAS